MEEGKNIPIEERKTLELGLLEKIDTLCSTHSWRYYLAYGTLLGAVRHQGFIPWDDDIDIIMERKDYDAMIAYFRSHQEEPYDLLSTETDSEYYYEYAKLVDHRTHVCTHGTKPIQREGIWVDIFPLDNVGKHVGIKKKIINLLVACRILSVYVTFPEKRSRIFYPLWWIAKLIGPRFFLRLTDRLARSGRGADHVAYMASMGVSRYALPKQWLEQTIRLPFEGKEFSTTAHYREYLTDLYGDYMQLPPVEKRISHPIDAVWRDK